MLSELEAIVEERAPVLTLQTQRWGFNQSTYSSNVANMRKFVQNRYAYALRYLCSYFGVNEAYLKSISGNYISVSYSANRMSLKINGSEVSNSWMVKFDSQITLNIVAMADTKSPRSCSPIPPATFRSTPVLPQRSR